MTDYRIPFYQSFAHLAIDEPGAVLHKASHDVASTAVHEAGHAVAARSFGRSVLAASIEPRPEGAGMVWASGYERHVRGLREHLIFLAAGHAAQRLFDRDFIEPADTSDGAEMVTVAKQIVGALAGFGAVDREVAAARVRAAALVQLRWDHIEQVAAFLLAHRELFTPLSRIWNATELGPDPEHGESTDDTNRTTERHPRPVGGQGADRTPEASGTVGRIPSDTAAAGQAARR